MGAYKPATVNLTSLSMSLLILQSQRDLDEGVGQSRNCLEEVTIPIHGNIRSLQEASGCSQGSSCKPNLTIYEPIHSVKPERVGAERKTSFDNFQLLQVKWSRRNSPLELNPRVQTLEDGHILLITEAEVRPAGQVFPFPYSLTTWIIHSLVITTSIIMTITIIMMIFWIKVKVLASLLKV